MQSVVCTRCNKVMGGTSCASKNGEKHIYYSCYKCKTTIAEKKLEKPLINFLNDMLDYFLLVDNTFKPYLNKDVEHEVNKYTKLLKELQTKEKRIKTAFIDGDINPKDFQPEFDSIKSQIEDIKLKINELKEVDEARDNRTDLRLIFNFKELEKQKLKSHYVREKGLWNELPKEKKKDLINKYIESIEVEKGKDGEVTIHNIKFRKSELKNIFNSFRSNCFDMIVNINEQDIILSNYKTETDINNYVKVLSEFYKVTKVTTPKELLNIEELLGKETLQIIPNKKENKFDKDIYTVLQIA